MLLNHGIGGQHALDQRLFFQIQLGAGGGEQVLPVEVEAGGQVALNQGPFDEVGGAGGVNGRYRHRHIGLDAQGEQDVVNGVLDVVEGVEGGVGG